ncbi:MAG: LysE family translocator [Bacteroidota bacterium]
MPSELFSFLIASMLLTISPGPDIIYVMVQSISTSKRQGLVVALGLVSGILIHTTLVAFGVSVILKENEHILWGIKVLGAIYLLFLAYKTATTNTEILLANGQKSSRFYQLFVRGFLMNVLNPKVSLFFLALLPGFIWNPTENLMTQFYSLGLIFMAQAFLIFALVAVFSDQLSKLILQKNYSKVIFKWLQVIVFVGISVFILW